MENVKYSLKEFNKKAKDRKEPDLPVAKLPPTEPVSQLNQQHCFHTYFWYVKKREGAAFRWWREDVEHRRNRLFDQSVTGLIFKRLSMNQNC